MTSDSRNTLWSNRIDTVLQAGTVSGGIHLHQTPDLMVVPRQLPLPPGRLVARNQELARIDATLERDGETVLVLIEGPGGIGKTALALHWAHHNLTNFTDGQLYADLKGFDSTGQPARPSFVIHGFLTALGVAPAAVPAEPESATALYRSIVAQKRIMILLDNAFDTTQVLPLLPGTSSCAVIVTSRQHLPGLRVRGGTSLRLDVLAEQDARTLLLRHMDDDAAAAEPESVRTLVECCGGLPLALAIVGARTASHPDFPLSALATELLQESACLNAFDTGDESASLRAVLSWSSASLPESEARAFRLVGSASVREFGVAAAASLLAVSAGEAGRLLRTLENKSLVRQHQPARFRMHDLVRLYAAELAATTDPDGTRTIALQRLVDFYLQAARTADQLLYPHRTTVDTAQPGETTIPVQLANASEAFEWFTLEHQQIFAAQQIALQQGWLPQVWQLSRALDTYHYRCSNLAESVESSRMGVSAADQIGDPIARMLAYRQLGRANTRAGNHADALKALESALKLAEETDIPLEQAHTHHDLGRAYYHSGAHTKALEHATASLACYETAGSTVGQAHALNALGRQYIRVQDYDRARQCCERALALHETHDNASGQVPTFDNLGRLAHLTGQHDQAIQHYSRALGLCGQLGNRFAEAEIHEHLAAVRHDQGDHERAEAAMRRAYDLYSAQHRMLDAERIRNLLGR